MQRIFISAHLKDDKNKNGEFYGRDVYEALHNIEELEIIEIKNHSNNIWCRDYMPVKSSSGKYVQFTYAPSYMMDSTKWKARLPNAKKIHKELKFDCISSDIVLDGGAIEVCDRKAIVSDRVFRDNPKKYEKDIRNEIKRKLELDQLIVVPQYPYDFTGHVDGLVRFIDVDRVVVNDIEQELNTAKSDRNTYRKKLVENWCYAFRYALINAGLELDYIRTSIPKDSPAISGVGIYVNFLLLDKMILMPSYDNKTDAEAAQKLEELYKIPVESINANKLSKEGGMINCVTWKK